MTQPEQPMSAADKLMEEIKSKRKAKNDIDNQEFVRFVMRMARVIERRGIGDPGILPLVMVLVQRFDEIIDVIIAANAERYHLIGEHAGASQAECARALGMSTQAAGKRKAKGEAIIARRLAAAGVAKLANKSGSAAEVEREKKAVQEASKFVVVALADYIARKAA